MLRTWLGDARIKEANLKEIIDWDYYTERLGKNIQKLVTIIAALQGVDNPVPNVPHPKWLQKRLNDQKYGIPQKKLTNFFQLKTGDEEKISSFVKEQRYAEDNEDGELVNSNHIRLKSAIKRVNQLTMK